MTGGRAPRSIDLVAAHASPLDEQAGGQSVHVRGLSAALADQGHDVTVWTRRDSAELPPVVTMRNGVRVHHLDAGPARPVPSDELVPHLPAMAATLRAAWLRRRPGVVHAHFWTSGLVALGAARDLDVPVVQTFHALGSVQRRHHGRDDAGPPGRVAAERYVGRQADRVVATCSDEVVELIRLGVPRRRIGLVPCGVSTDVFTPSGPILPRSPRRRLVTVGRLARRKGVDETIAALAGVPDAELLVAGGTGPGDPDVARLHALAANRGVGDRVRFVGPVARADVPALLRSADAVVCVPWYAPFGIVALEAMACGRPVVAGAVGGLVDTVVDGVTGVLVAPRRPRELAAALRALLASPSSIAALGSAGRDRAVVRYGWDRIAAATADVYDQVRGEDAPADPALASPAGS
ncbi:MAG: glycosyltransferase [Pseudonocardia sp.]